MDLGMQFQKRYPGNIGPVEAMPAMPAMPSDMFQERQVFDRLQMPTMQSAPTNFARAPGGTEVFQQHLQPRMDQVMPNGQRHFGQAPNAGFRPLGSQDGFNKMLPISQETPGYVLNGQFQNLPQAAAAPSKAVYLQPTNIPTPFNCFLIGGDSPKDVKVASPTSPGGFIQAFPLMPLQQERQAQQQVVPVLQPSQLPQQPMTCGDQDVIASEGSIGHPELCRRPCFYFAKGCCENGANCGYCHLPHGERAPKLDKRQRLVLQSLPENILLEMLQRAVRGRAEQHYMAGAAIGEILQLWERRLATLQPLKLEDSEHVAERYVRNLNKILRRMNISELVALAIRGAKEDSLYVTELREALGRLRQKA